jgi:hypothetical protein
MTENLRYEEIKKLVKNNTSLQLAEKLQFFLELQRNGNVYLENIPDDMYTARELLRMAYNDDDEKFDELLNFSFETDSKSQSRSIRKKSKHNHMLKFSKKLASVYVDDYKICAPRIKKTKYTKEILDGHSCHSNFYPGKYIDIAKKYLKDYPLEQWGDVKTSSKLDEKFEEMSDNKYRCKRCSKHVQKQSRSSHLKSIKCKNFQ